MRFEEEFELEEDTVFPLILGIKNTINKSKNPFPVTNDKFINIGTKTNPFFEFMCQNQINPSKSTYP